MAPFPIWLRTSRSSSSSDDASTNSTTTVETGRKGSRPGPSTILAADHLVLCRIQNAAMARWGTQFENACDQNHPVLHPCDHIAPAIFPKNRRRTKQATMDSSSHSNTKPRRRKRTSKDGQAAGGRQPSRRRPKSSSGTSTAKMSVSMDSASSKGHEEIIGIEGKEGSINEDSKERRPLQDLSALKNNIKSSSSIRSSLSSRATRGSQRSCFTKPSLRPTASGEPSSPRSRQSSTINASSATRTSSRPKSRQTRPNSSRDRNSTRGSTSTLMTQNSANTCSTKESSDRRTIKSSSRSSSRGAISPTTAARRDTRLSTKSRGSRRSTAANKKCSVKKTREHSRPTVHRRSKAVGPRRSSQLSTSSTIHASPSRQNSMTSRAA